MASIFGHVAASSAIGYTAFPRNFNTITFLIAGFCAFAPDLDVLAFRFGIPYSSQWGHRGWTHSIVFAIVFGIVITLLYKALSPKNTVGFKTGLFFVLSTLSHPLLDMFTNGGRGCAIWWPFSTERIFFPFRPIQVSPMSVGGFLSEWGIKVLMSELIWIGVPLMALSLIVWWRRKFTIEI
ncbi:MAG: metal-dependent hydrolase [Lewinellaceae bacterium]|nr:metal-dependent hydrolase [Saprospiraceae bacterium]MCB9342269.1 metal-dependent hydrolase [Lewinellaceae bacterium]